MALNLKYPTNRLFLKNENQIEKYTQISQNACIKEALWIYMISKEVSKGRNLVLLIHFLWRSSLELFRQTAMK